VCVLIFICFWFHVVPALRFHNTAALLRNYSLLFIRFASKMKSVFHHVNTRAGAVATLGLGLIISATAMDKFFSTHGRYENGTDIGLFSFVILTNDVSPVFSHALAENPSFSGSGLVLN
jgi:hypothetical protein